MKMQDRCAAKGVLEIWHRDAAGRLLNYWKDGNLVVDSGRGLQVSSVAVAVNRAACGTNGASADPADVCPLQDQVLKAFASVTPLSARSVAYSFLFGPSDANGITIREFGLVAHASGDTLFARRGGYSIVKTADDLVQGTWTVTF